MTFRNSLKTTSHAAALAAAISLIAAAPGLGAPAGDEYLPGVPAATGDQGGGGGGGAAAGAGAGPASVPGSTTRDEEASSAGGKGNHKQPNQAKPETATAVTAASEEESSGLLDTLLDPVVLLLIGGVVIVAVGMTLRRGQGDDQGEGPDRAPRDPATAPHTPPGEIVADGERRS